MFALPGFALPRSGIVSELSYSYGYTWGNWSIATSSSTMEYGYAVEYYGL